MLAWIRDHLLVCRWPVLFVHVYLWSGHLSPIPHSCGSPPAQMLLQWTFSMPPWPAWLGQLHSYNLPRFQQEESSMLPSSLPCFCSAPGMLTAHGAPLSVSRTIRQQLLSESFVAQTYWQLYRLLLLILLPYREDKIPDTNGNSAASICHNYSNYIVFTLSYESVTVCI